MTLELFNSLTPQQQKAMLISQQIREALEPLHAKPDGWITDDQMKEMNQTIRQAVFDALESFDRPSCTALEVMCVPSYWEIPESKIDRAPVKEVAL